jgi:hypothetical protein
LIARETGRAPSTVAYWVNKFGLRSLHAEQHHFHHVDPGEKAFAFSRHGVTRSLAAARAEAAKCVLLCSNCHAEVEAGTAKLPASLLL